MRPPRPRRRSRSSATTNYAAAADMSRPAATLLATSLKMYLDHDQTVAWTRQVREIAARSEAVRRGSAELAVFPSFPSIPVVAEILADVPVATGGQNMSEEPSGALPGE